VFLSNSFIILVKIKQQEKNIYSFINPYLYQIFYKSNVASYMPQTDQLLNNQYWIFFSLLFLNSSLIVEKIKISNFKNVVVV
jgi:hypothetical protein